MRSARQRLLLASCLYLISSCLGLWIAAREQFAAHFLGILNGQDPVSDALLLGSGLSAPLILLALQLLCMLGLWRDVRRQACVLGLTLLGCLYLLGQLGETILWQAFTPVLRPEVAGILLANLLCPLGMIVFGLKTRQ